MNKSAKSCTKDGDILAFIGARGGSKGLPGKNTLEFCGKPLIHWTINAARSSAFVDEVFVSTDCNEIASVSRDAGAELPYLRPRDMAEDDSPIGMAIDHTLRWFEKRGRQFKYIMLLQPTSPLRTCGHIDDALRSFFSQRRSEEDTLVSVYKAAQKASWLIQEDKDGYGHFCVDHHADRRSRQTLAQLYYPNGAIYMAPTLGFKGEFYGPKAKLYIMDECDSIDIDDKSDFERAKEAHLLREMKKSLDC